MPKIETIYIVSHTHTDIGYTDHQDSVFRQQLEFIDRAIELGEATADYPSESRYKWTCEVTAFVERYFQERPARQIDRFLELHRRGQMAARAFNLAEGEQTIALSFPALTPAAAWACSPVEEDGAALPIHEDAVPLVVPSRSIACARVVFDEP